MLTKAEEEPRAGGWEKTRNEVGWVAKQSHMPVLEIRDCRMLNSNCENCAVYCRKEG
jgi:hypothetical protein